MPAAFCLGEARPLAADENFASKMPPNWQQMAQASWGWEAVLPSFVRPAVLAGCLLVSVSMPVAPAAAQGDAILILDASGSMWGQVDGQSKISAARRAVDSILAKWRPGDRLGLMTYGHRTKGDCKDIELLVPVSKFDPARIRDAVNGLNPKGKTPMADALRAAAQALRATENKATVVLVSDGIETCHPDPCAVAAELKKAGVGFTAHVIGFDVADPAAKTQLQCIARATGGVYLDAGNADGLEKALGRAVEAAQGGKMKSEAPAKPVADAYQGKNIRGVVRLGPSLDPVTDSNNDVVWSFFTPRGGEKGEHVTTFHGAPFADVIAPGSYVLEVQYGLVTRQHAVTVEKGKPLALDIVLDAGYVTSEGTVQGSGEKMQEPTWEVINAKGEVVTTEYKPVPRFVLPSGSYTLRLTRGNAASEKAFVLAAGDSINVPMTLDAGRLLVSAVYAPGGPQAEKGFAVEARKPSVEEGKDGEWVATIYDPLSKFDLPAGSYDVIASVGVARKTVRVEVKTGAPTRLEINLDAGVLGMKLGPGKSVEIFGTERDINNERVSFGTYFDENLNLALGAGAYVAVISGEGGESHEKEFTVTAGKRIDVDARKQ